MIARLFLAACVLVSAPVVLPVKLAVKAVQNANDKYSWQKFETKNGVEWALWKCDGQSCRQIGAFRERDSLYLPFDGKAYGSPDCIPEFVDLPPEIKAKYKPPQTPEPPVKEPPARKAPVPCEVQNYGIDLEALKNYKGPAYSINGRKASRYDALAKLGSFTDDADRPFLTIIGPKDDCDRVRADIDNLPVLKQVRDNWRVQSYPADDMARAVIADDGFKTGGHPTIYLQSPDGTVLHRQDNYQSAEQLAQAARRADPKYDPNKDPDLSKTPSIGGVDLAPFIDWLKKLPGVVYAAVLGLGGLFVLPNRKPAAA